MESVRRMNFHNNKNKNNCNNSLTGCRLFKRSTLHGTVKSSKLSIRITQDSNTKKKITDLVYFSRARTE